MLQITRCQLLTSEKRGLETGQQHRGSVLVYKIGRVPAHDVEFLFSVNFCRTRGNEGVGLWATGVFCFRGGTS